MENTELKTLKTKTMIITTEKKLKIRNGSKSALSKWQGLEEGSFEDAGRPENGHLYNLLDRFMQGKTFVEVTREEANSALDSLEYWLGAPTDQMENDKGMVISMRAFASKFESAIEFAS